MLHPSSPELTQPSQIHWRSHRCFPSDEGEGGNYTTILTEANSAANLLPPINAETKICPSGLSRSSPDLSSLPHLSIYCVAWLRCQAGVPTGASLRSFSPALLARFISSTCTASLESSSGYLAAGLRGKQKSKSSARYEMTTQCNSKSRFSMNAAWSPLR